MAPLTVEWSSEALISTTTAAQTQPSAESQTGERNSPMGPGRLQIHTNGITAKGNCRLSTT